MTFSPEEYSAIFSHWVHNAEPVCGRSSEDQIAWLSEHADAPLLHDATIHWNWDWGTEVLFWMMLRPGPQLSAVSFQLAGWVTGGSLNPDFANYLGNDDITVFTQIAAKIRRKEYPNQWGLGHQSMSGRSKAEYEKCLSRHPRTEDWSLPSEAFGPFNDFSPKSKVEFNFSDEHGGNIMPTVEKWGIDHFGKSADWCSH